MHMRPSRVLEKLRAGKVAACFKINLESARAVELAAMAGFDCIWADMEHTANDWSLLEHQIWAAKTQNCDILTRVSRGCYNDYIKPLELDSAGLMVPHIMSLADAKNVVKMTRFQPLGLRAVDGGNADGAYCKVDFHDYLRTANQQRFVAIQIEDPEPLDELDEIAKLDGIDIIFFGPADFSHSIGAPGQWDHPKILETRRRIAEVCQANGKYAGIPGNPGNIAELVELGYRFINMGADVIGLDRYCAEMMDGFRPYM